MLPFTALSLFYRSTSNGCAILADSTVTCSSFQLLLLFAPNTHSCPKLILQPGAREAHTNDCILPQSIRASRDESGLYKKVSTHSVFFAPFHLKLLLSFYLTTLSHIESFIYPYLMPCPDALNLPICYIRPLLSIDGCTILPPSCQSCHAKLSIVPLFDPFTPFNTNVVSLPTCRPLVKRQHLAFKLLI